jgi:hypothetical protein
LSFGLELGAKPIDRNSSVTQDSSMATPVSPAQSKPISPISQNPTTTQTALPDTKPISRDYQSKNIDFNLQDVDAKINNVKSSLFSIPKAENPAALQ